MSSNPYIVTHFGSSMDFFRNGRATSDSHDDFDAASGFSRFPQSKHMTTSVFRPSHPSAPSRPEPAGVQTPPDNIFKLRNRFLTRKFPSRPPTPGSTSTGGSAGLPPLLPPSVAMVNGFSGNSGGNGGARSTTTSTPTGETQSSHNGEDDDGGSAGARPSASPGSMGGGDACTPPPISSHHSRPENPSLHSRRWAPKPSPVPLSVTAFLGSGAAAAKVPPSVETRSSRSNDDGAPEVSPISASPAPEGCVSPPTQAVENNLAEGTTGQAPATPVASSPPAAAATAAGEKSQVHDSSDVEGLVSRSRAALAEVEHLLESATPVPDYGERDKNDSDNGGAAFSAPPPLPRVSAAAEGGADDGRAPVPTTAASSNHPVSPLQDDDFLQFLSPASETYPQEFPHRQSTSPRSTAVPTESEPAIVTTDAVLAEENHERRIIASLCCVPAQQAERSLGRRAHNNGRRANTAETSLYPDRTQLAEGLDSLCTVLRQRQQGGGDQVAAEVRRPTRHCTSEESPDWRPAKRHHGKRHGSRSRSSRANHDSVSVDQFADLLAQLNDFLHGTGGGGGGGGGGGVTSDHRLSSGPGLLHAEAAHRDGGRAAARRQTHHDDPGTAADSAVPSSRAAQDRAGSDPTQAATRTRRTLAPPTVLVGQQPSQISLLSRRPASHSRSRVAANRGLAPSYALPTESWLQKNVEDSGEW